MNGREGGRGRGRGRIEEREGREGREVVTWIYCLDQMVEGNRTVEYWRFGVSPLEMEEGECTTV